MPRPKKYYPLRKCRKYKRSDRPIRCDYSSSDSCDSYSFSSCDYKSYDYYDCCKDYSCSDDYSCESHKCDTCHHRRCRCPGPAPGIIPGTPCRVNGATGGPLCNPCCNYTRTGPYCRFGNRNCNSGCCGTPVNLDWSEALGGWSYSLNVGWIPIVPGTTQPYPYYC